MPWSEITTITVSPAACNLSIVEHQLFNVNNATRRLCEHIANGLFPIARQNSCHKNKSTSHNRIFPVPACTKILIPDNYIIFHIIVQIRFQRHFINQQCTYAISFVQANNTTFNGMENIIAKAW
jgi:hypothetical protein